MAWNVLDTRHDLHRFMHTYIHIYIYMIHIREVADPYSHVTNMWQRFKYRTPRCDYWWNTRPTPQGKSQENILCTGSYPTTILRWSSFPDWWMIAVYPEILHLRQGLVNVPFWGFRSLQISEDDLPNGGCLIGTFTNPWSSPPKITSVFCTGRMSSQAEQLRLATNIGSQCVALWLVDFFYQHGSVVDPIS